MIRARTLAAVRTVTAANVPGTPLEMQEAMPREAHLYVDIAAQKEWRHQRPERALSHLVSAALRRAMHRPEEFAKGNGVGMNGLRSILHAPLRHAQHQQP